jgi:hypothetical protein
LNSQARPTALHPYYKLAYIKLAWGGAKEQDEERAAGNPHAKNWQDEAQKVLEHAVRIVFLCKFNSKLTLEYAVDGGVLATPPKDRTNENYACWHSFLRIRQLINPVGI